MKLQNKKFYKAHYSNGHLDLTTVSEIKAYCSKNNVTANIYWAGGQSTASTFQGTYS